MTKTNYETWNTHSLIKTSLASLVVIVAAYLLNYGINTMLARWLGAVIYGDYAAGISALRLTSVFILLGMDYAIIRFIPEYLWTSDWGSISGYLRRSFKLLTLVGLSVFTAGVLIGIGLYISDMKEIFTFDEHHPFFLFLWAIPLVALNTYLGKLLRSTRHVYLSLISLNIAQPVMLFLTLSVFMLIGHQVTIHEAMFAFVISTLLVLVWQSVATCNALPYQVMQSEPRYEANWMKVAIQLLIAAFLATNLNNLVIILSEIFDPIEKHTGLLSAIFTICNSLWLTYAAVMTVLSPLISPAVKEANKARLQVLTNVGNGTMLIVNLLLLTVILFFGKHILQHFGPSFVVAYPALVTVAGMFTFALMSGMSLPLLQYSGNQKIIIKISIAGTIMLIILGGVMSRYYGLIGSIVAVCIVQLTISICSAFWVRKIFGIKPFIFF